MTAVFSAECARSGRAVAVALFLLLLHMFGSQAYAQGEPRWALVIGNNAYRHVGSLRTAVNDAAAMAAPLRQLRFEVLERPDLDRAGMYRAVRELAEHAAGGIAVVYYAGHGVQIRGRSFLLPVDIDVGGENDVVYNAVPLDDVLNLLAGARAKLTVAFVDACRDNPLPPTARGIERGLAQPKEVPYGQMVVYAAGAGEQALDRLGPEDTNPNGLFVRELLPELQKPGVALHDAVDAAAARVAQEAAAVHHDQHPAIYKAYYGQFYLVPGRAPLAEPSEEAGAYNGEDRTAFAVIRDSTRARDFELFLAQYPKSPLAPFLQSRLEELKGKQVVTLPPPKSPEPTPAT